ncbi:YidH family protein [Alteribacter keqinensis]|uniref:DUF202 domain-containing protein n=1 Tax=Alteribacter keqinensis TaxID=2483800 RepID=A0A3M7TN74_9BACI|nr:DUF202 domain-containing protein [Alteribacter keqinensis]RNA66694.1 DUF202 domain-containing protein [Alteribacter keqinensis]
MEKNPDSKTLESQYIQQHLANERTFLAWVRTALALKGIGFLATSLHFTTLMHEHYSYTLAITISVASFTAGLLIISTALYLYLRNRKAINAQQFTSSSVAIVSISIVVILVLFLLLTYFLTSSTP